jgi:mannose/cellobiose epimerase-like protein (N-acyl-D-glucosamine 2-epimerase family)
MSRRRSTALPADFLGNWLFAKTLPYWARHGYDRDCGGFHERLDEARRPVVSDGKRVMVQCRQIYVFAQAALFDRMREARDLALGGHDFLIAHGRHPGGGWRFRVARDGGAMDDTRDLYTHAFVLFALAWRYRLDRNEAARALADETMRFLDQSMAHPAGGYHEGIDPAGRPTAGPRRQNPHMHLFEAMLEWHAASGDAIWLRRAADLAELLAARFCVDGTLREYFAADLSPASGEQGRLVEPGHHYEWSWLLYRYRQRSGDGRYAALAAALYEFAETHGIDSASSGVIDAVDCDGEPVRRSRRCWPQTEAIKAHVARFEATGDSAFRRQIQDQTGAFVRYHLDGSPEGAWREHLAEDGRPLVSALPASSLYHITLAAAELERLRRGS